MTTNETTAEQSLGALLESVIDRKSLEHVLETLREICYAKAEHVETNWQDGDLAKQWERRAEAIEACAAKVTKLRVY